MRNQTSFRLTTTLKPNDMTAKTTTVINKVDEGGNKYYPNFREETVVITNDDRTMMETTKASCNNGVLTFNKRGLSDDGSQAQIENRKLSWNPGSLCFVTIGAGDIIDTGDDLYWNGEQTFEGSATFDGMLTTHKGVQYPVFTNLAELEAYTDPFPGMFAVLESDGELYRYNAVNQEWSVVTTATPVQPEMASISTIGTVRGATDAEYAAGTGTGSHGELLIATPAQIQNIGLHITNINQSSSQIYQAGQSTSITYTAPRAGFIKVTWTQFISKATTGGSFDNLSCNHLSVSGNGTTAVIFTPEAVYNDGYNHNWQWHHQDLVAVSAGEITFTMTVDKDIDITAPDVYKPQIYLRQFFYFG